MKRYSDLEVETLIEEVSQAAYEAIEQAASEAARAAAIDALEREAALARQTQHWKSEVEKKAEEIKAAKKAGRKNTVIGVLIGFVGGVAAGATVTLLMSK
jgi:CRISPR/Cas system CSM-associated protein Csm5 (group 7 of RAMP superfamily)